MYTEEVEEHPEFWVADEETANLYLREWGVG
jgi:hypothetical protein